MADDEQIRNAMLDAASTATEHTIPRWKLQEAIKEALLAGRDTGRLKIDFCLWGEIIVARYRTDG